MSGAGSYRLDTSWKKRFATSCSKADSGVRESLEASIAERVGSDSEMFDHTSGGRIDDRGGVGIPMSVHADDEVDDTCEHCCHGASLLSECHF